MKKGRVGPTNQSGIKQLTPGTKVSGKIYQFEIKVLNKGFKDWRVYGNYNHDRTRIIFDLLGKALH